MTRGNNDGKPRKSKQEGDSRMKVPEKSKGNNELPPANVSRLNPESLIGCLSASGYRNALDDIETKVRENHERYTKEVERLGIRKELAEARHKLYKKVVGNSVQIELVQAEVLKFARKWLPVNSNEIDMGKISDEINHLKATVLPMGELPENSTKKRRRWDQASMPPL